MVSVPCALPLEPAPSSASRPEPATVTRWPLATTLSGSPAGNDAQVNEVTALVPVPPGETPAAASASAEELQPPPSKLARDGSESGEMPALSTVACQLPGCATSTVSTACVLATPGAENVTGMRRVPSEVPAGTVTVTVACAL